MQEIQWEDRNQSLSLYITRTLKEEIVGTEPPIFVTLSFYIKGFVYILRITLGSRFQYHKEAMKTEFLILGKVNYRWAHTISNSAFSYIAINLFIFFCFELRCSKNAKPLSGFIIYNNISLTTGEANNRIIIKTSESQHILINFSKVIRCKAIPQHFVHAYID